MTDDLLALRDVTVGFGGLTALDGVGLTIPPRTVVGVIGPNGAGKTTLFNVICGLVRPDRGQLLWRGVPLRRHRPDRLARLGIARTLQGLDLFAGLTVLENLTVGGARAERARDLLAALELTDVADRLPGSLPYGVRKRVALARALAVEPALLLLDEPASGLSAAELDDLAERIVELRERMAVVLVEHNMDLVMRVSDRIEVLNFGRVIASGPPAHVQRDPAVVAAYLGRIGETAGA